MSEHAQPLPRDGQWQARPAEAVDSSRGVPRQRQCRTRSLGNRLVVNGLIAVWVAACSSDTTHIDSTSQPGGAAGAAGAIESGIDDRGGIGGSLGGAGESGRADGAVREAGGSGGGSDD